MTELSKSSVGGGLFASAGGAVRIAVRGGSRSVSWWSVAALFLLLATSPAVGQALRFSNHRQVEVPEYATVRIGPFYSTVRFTQSAGYRHVKSRGAGTDFLELNRRGRIRSDGGEFPLISTLDFRNYLLITPNTDVDMSVRMRYEYYPLNTQEDDFIVDFVEEGVLGTLSSEFRLTPFVRGRLYDDIVYRTDYVDTRGIVDDYGGERYRFFRNIAGVDLDWLLADNQSVWMGVNRTDLLPMDDEFDSQEHVSYYEKIGYDYTLTPGVTLGAGLGFRQTDYKDPARADTTQQDYLLTTKIDPESGFRITEHSTLTFGLGYSRGGSSSSLSTNGVQLERDFETVTGNVAMETELSRELSHELSYGRSLRGGFQSAFEVIDRYSYELRWNTGDLITKLFTDLTSVDPSRVDVNGYSDWRSGFDISYPLARYIRLLLSTSYTVRKNETIGLSDLVDGADAEQFDDYTTWVSNLGTRFAVTRSIDFYTYVQHVERDSDSEDLTYERDTFSAMFTYTHDF